MSELIQHYIRPVEDSAGVAYDALIFGQEREDGTWEGWVEFRPADDGDAPVLRTERETSQPNKGALAYWASGLEAIYFDGALRRAR